MTPSEVIQLTPFEVILQTEPNFMKHRLAQYGLVPLESDTHPKFSEHYRFLWLRSFHPAVLIEIKVIGPTEQLFEAKLWKGRGKSGKWEVQRSRKITETVKRTHWDRLSAGGFFKLPFLGEKSGFDGSDWFIEAQRGKSYHAVYRWSPHSGIVYDFGRYLIEAAIESEFLPIY